MKNERLFVTVVVAFSRHISRMECETSKNDVILSVYEEIESEIKLALTQFNSIYEKTVLKPSTLVINVAALEIALGIALQPEIFFN